MEFAQLLSKLMNERALTNYQLAKDLDIHPTTVANWLDGKTPRKKTLAVLSDYFGVSVDYLLGNEDAAAVYEDDDELNEILEDVRRNPELRAMFSITKKATPEQVRQYIKVIKALRGGDDDE